MTPVLPMVEIGLNAAIVCVTGETPRILVTTGGADEHEGLPFGPFDPLAHRTMETGLRGFVSSQTGLALGYVEQLYTFGDRGRNARAGDPGPHVVSVGYLALTRHAEGESLRRAGVRWSSWYDYFPWEDVRGGRAPLLDRVVLPALDVWAAMPPTSERALPRRERVALLFGRDGLRWDEEKVLERYECLYEAGLVAEAARDGREGAREPPVPLGRAMRFDHRRILATAMGRLRSKLKYRPVVFEVMPDVFTLTALQTTVEAISGTHLHKQNFRRLVEAADLVEPTGEVSLATGGRPAQLHRFRREVTRERPAPPGLRVFGQGGRG